VLGKFQFDDDTTLMPKMDTLIRGEEEWSGGDDEKRALARQRTSIVDMCAASPHLCVLTNRGPQGKLLRCWDLSAKLEVSEAAPQGAHAHNRWHKPNLALEDYVESGAGPAALDDDYDSRKQGEMRFRAAFGEGSQPFKGAERLEKTEVGRPEP
jgi:hypothetical protein